MEWFRPLTEGLGYTFPSMAVPAPLMFAVGYALEVAHLFGAPEPTLTRRGVRNLTESSSFCVDKARERLGYQPRYRRDTGIPLLLDEARQKLAALGAS